MEQTKLKALELNAAKARLSQGRRPLRRRKREDGGQ